MGRSPGYANLMPRVGCAEAIKGHEETQGGDEDSNPYFGHITVLSLGKCSKLYIGGPHFFGKCTGL